MTLLTPPKDVNWLGHWRAGPYMLLPITSLVALLWILTIATIGYGLTHGPYPGGSPMDNFLRPDRDSADLTHMLWMLGVETVHLPLHVLLFFQSFRGWRLHPVFALTVSTVMIPAWSWFAALNLLLFWSCECQQSDTWNGLAYSRVAICIIIPILYTVYMGFAARAVHEWRGRTGRRRGVRGQLKNRVSLEEGGTPGEIELSTGKQ